METCGEIYSLGNRRLNLIARLANSLEALGLVRYLLSFISSSEGTMLKSSLSRSWRALIALARWSKASLTHSLISASPRARRTAAILSLGDPF